jgi:hypothetical protein
MNSNLFIENDFNSGEGFNTNIFGPPLWFILHLISFNYPVNPTEEDKKNYYNFLISVGKVLPCKYCRDNFENNLKAIEFNKDVFKNRKTFSMFVFRLHNCVNKMLGKDCPISYNEVRERFEMFRARCYHKPEEIKKEKTIEKTIEKGCTNPLYGVKSKVTLHIVPLKKAIKTITIDPRCIPKKITSLFKKKK